MAIYYVDLYNGNDANDGLSWGTAWKTVTFGATAARLAFGDEVRLSKTPDPVSIGTATWTCFSKEVILDTALTKTIDSCDDVWTPSANVNYSRQTVYCKEGEAAAQFQFLAGFTTGKAAYRSFPADDFSAFQKISFFMRPSYAITSPVIKICLCSDTVGDVIVDSFTLTEPQYGNNYYRPITIEKDGGGNLGSSIQSIAIYTIADPGTPTIGFDNFIACSLTGLNLQSLISKNGLGTGGFEAFYSIQGITGNSVILGSKPASYKSEGQGYYGVTENVETYIRDTFKTEQTSSGYHVDFLESGVYYKGGYVVGTEVRDGDTLFDGTSGFNYGGRVNNMSDITISRISFFRYTMGLYITGNGANRLHIEEIHDIACSNTHGIYFNALLDGIRISKIWNLHSNAGMGARCYRGVDWQIDTIHNVICNGNNGISFEGLIFSKIKKIDNLCNNGYYGFNFSTASSCDFEELDKVDSNREGFYFSDTINCIFRKINSCNNNIYNSVSFVGSSCNNKLRLSSFDRKMAPTGNGDNFILDASYSDLITTIFNGFSYTHAKLYFLNFNNILGKQLILSYQSYLELLLPGESFPAGSSASSVWRVHFSGTSRNAGLYREKIAEVAFEANKQVTVSIEVSCKWEHASFDLIVPKNLSIGITEEIVSTISGDLTDDWRILSVSFTPTVKGVSEIILCPKIGQVITYTYFGAISVTQAD